MCSVPSGEYILTLLLYWHVNGMRQTREKKTLDSIIIIIIIIIIIDVEYIYGFVRWGVCKQSRWRHSVPHSRWRICVTIATLWQQQDGCCMLLWIGPYKYISKKVVRVTTMWLCDGKHNNTDLSDKRKPNSDEQQTIFCIFNSTVIDWTCYIFYYFKFIPTYHLSAGGLLLSPDPNNRSKRLTPTL